MKYILDTNICIYIIKNHPESVLKKFKSFDIGDVCISSVTLAEGIYLTPSAFEAGSVSIMHDAQEIEKLLML